MFTEGKSYRFGSVEDRIEFIDCFPKMNEHFVNLVGNCPFTVLKEFSGAVESIMFGGTQYKVKDIAPHCKDHGYLISDDESKYFIEHIERVAKEDTDYVCLVSLPTIGQWMIYAEGSTEAQAREWAKNRVEQFEDEEVIVVKGVTRFKTETKIVVTESKF